VILQPDGSFTYTPNPGFSGVDTFVYRVADSTGRTATATVRITVTQAIVALAKSVSLYTPTAAFPFRLPGNDMIYSVEVHNTGTGPVVADTLFVTDPIPPQTAMLFADIDQGGPDAFPGSDAVGFTNGGSDLDFVFSRDVRFSDQVAAPATIAGCTYTPVAGYDPAIRHLCIAPRGALRAGGRATFHFRVRIK
jgi:uncharacterized repeat protein (TIGR01451 family)